MRRLFHLPLVAVLALSPLYVHAEETLQVLHAEGQVRQELFGAPSPTPQYCYWESLTDITTFQATNADGYGNMDCPDPWLVHCDADSLAFQGSWPLLDIEYLLSSSYSVDLTCSVSITAVTQLSVLRIVSGELDIDQHTLTIKFPDGTEHVLLQDGAGPDQAQIALMPGHYQIELHVYAYKQTVYGQAIAPYSGIVALRWGDSDLVATQPVSWSSLKANYH